MNIGININHFNLAIHNTRLFLSPPYCIKNINWQYKHLPFSFRFQFRFNHPLSDTQPFLSPPSWLRQQPSKVRRKKALTRTLASDNGSTCPRLIRKQKLTIIQKRNNWRALENMAFGHALMVSHILFVCLQTGNMPMYDIYRCIILFCFRIIFCHFAIKIILSKMHICSDTLIVSYTYFKKE